MYAPDETGKGIPPTAFIDLGWHTVKSIDKMRLRAGLVEPDWSSLRYLGMDVLALIKDIATPPWWSIRSTVKCCGSGPGAH